MVMKLSKAGILCHNKNDQTYVVGWHFHLYYSRLPSPHHSLQPWLLGYSLALVIIHCEVAGADENECCYPLMFRHVMI